jgi:hypothetical protein
MTADARRPALATTALLVSLTLLTAACAPRETRDEVTFEGNALQDPGATLEPGPGLPPPDTVPTDGEVQVTLADGEIQMPQTLAAGRTTFRVRNAGTREHSLEIEGEGIEEELQPRLQPGQEGALVVDLTAGSYRFYCPVDDHAELGMELQVQVTGAAGAAPGSTPPGAGR